MIQIVFSMVFFAFATNTLFAQTDNEIFVKLIGDEVSLDSAITAKVLKSQYNWYGKYIKFFLTVLFFMVIAIRGIEAANHVKVATIGSHPGIVDKSKGMQHVVDQV